MKKIFAKLSILMLIITAIFGAGSRVSAEENKEVQPESAILTQEEKDEVGEILLSLMEASTSKNGRSALSNVSAEVQATITAKAEAIAAIQANSGSVFDEIYHGVNIYSAKITEDGKLNVNVRDTAVIWYHDQGAEENTDYCSYATTHDITMERVGGEWFVLRDSFDERMVTGIASEDILQAEETAEVIPATKDVLKNLGGGERGMNTVFTYNSTKLNNAIQYAIQYCGMTETQLMNHGYAAWDTGATHPNNYNSAYINLSSTYTDCCNFVSQILKAAGMSYDTVWYYDGWSSPLAWTNVIPFINHFDDYYTVEYVNSSYSNVYPGNPVFWRNQDTNHIMFCVGYNNSGYPVVCGHTHDIFRYPINWIGKTLETLKIATSNLHSHTQTWVHNTSYHYKICSVCRYLFTSGTHTVNSNGVCTICGATGVISPN